MAIWQRRQRKPQSAGHQRAHGELADDAAPITVTAQTWRGQFTELWEHLVPSAGAAATEQGEVIRLAGKLSREILDNGSINWNADFRAMSDELVAYLSYRTPVASRRELERLRKIVRRGGGWKPELYRLHELAVSWVLANPHPVALGHTPYRN